MEDGSFRPRTRLLKHCTINLSTNQSEGSHTHCNSQPKFYLLKFISPQTIGEFGFCKLEPPVLSWPCNKPFSAPNSSGSVCLASLCVAHTDFCSVTVELRFKQICCPAKDLPFHDASVSMEWVTLGVVIVPKGFCIDGVHWTRRFIELHLAVSLILYLR